MEPQSFHTPKTVADLEDGMVDHLQNVGAAVAELGAVFAGGSNQDLTPEDLQRLRDERPILQPIFDTLVPLMEETGKVAGHMVKITQEVAEGRKKMGLLVSSVKEGDRSELVMSYTRQSIEGWQKQKPALEEVHDLLTDLCGKWDSAKGCTEYAKDRMSERVRATQEAYEQIIQERWVLSRRAGTAVTCAILGISVGSAVLVCWYQGNVDIAGYLTLISGAVSAIAYTAKWDPRVEEGILAAARKVRDALRLEGEVQEVLKLLKDVQESLEALTEAVRTQAEDGFKAKQDVRDEANLDKISKPLQKFGDTIALAAVGEMDLEGVAEFLSDMKSDKPDELQGIEASLLLAVKRGRDLSEQLELWKDNCKHVEVAMTRLQKHLTDAEAAERSAKVGASKVASE